MLTSLSRLEGNNELLSELRTTKAKLEAQFLKQENQLEELNQKLEKATSDKADVESELSIERAKLADAAKIHQDAIDSLEKDLAQVGASSYQKEA